MPWMTGVRFGVPLDQKPLVCLRPFSAEPSSPIQDSLEARENFNARCSRWAGL